EPRLEVLVGREVDELDVDAVVEVEALLIGDPQRPVADPRRRAERHLGRRAGAISGRRLSRVIATARPDDERHEQSQCSGAERPHALFLVRHPLPFVRSPPRGRPRTSSPIDCCRLAGPAGTHLGAPASGDPVETTTATSGYSLPASRACWPR